MAMCDENHFNLTLRVWQCQIGAFIGFELNLLEYFQTNDYTKYCLMQIVGSAGLLRIEHGTAFF
jgi:hypothetical protein